MRRARSVGTALLLVAAIAASAWAALTKVSDVNDTRGLMDVRTVRFDPGGPPEWTVITFNAWTVRSIWDRGYVLVYLDTMGDDSPDYYALIRSNGHRMLGDLYRDRDTIDHRITSLHVWRNGGHQVSVRIPLRLLDIGVHRTVYRWSVLTLFTSSKCRQTCFDPVPDTDMVDQSISPSPTPSPTVSAAPSIAPEHTRSPKPSGTPGQEAPSPTE